MKMGIFYPLLASASLLVSGFVVGQESQGDMRALQGKWKVWLTPDQSIVIEVKGDSFSMTSHSRTAIGEPSKGSFTLDEKAEPKQMTWKDVKGGGLNLEINRCIYELHGDTWILIGGIKNRPMHFYSGDGKSTRAWVLKREK